MVAESVRVDSAIQSGGCLMLLIWPLVGKIHFFNRLLEGEFDIFFGLFRRNLNRNLE